jgi:uncharacterized protein
MLHMAARYHANGLRVIDGSLIDEVVRTIVDALGPKRIVLFGSHARGDAGPDSDIDLMIEMETDLPFLERSLAVDRLFPHRLWALDAVVYTPAEVLRDTNRPGTLLSMIEREARTLYDQSRVRA